MRRSSLRALLLLAALAGGAQASVVVHAPLEEVVEATELVLVGEVAAYQETQAGDELRGDYDVTLADAPGLRAHLVYVQPVAAESTRARFSIFVRNVNEQPPSESSKCRRPRMPPVSLATCSPSNGWIRAGRPISVWNVGLALSIVPFEEVHVSSISSQRPR